MKKLYPLLFALVICLCATSSQAFWVGSVTAPGYTTATNVEGFDWSSSGSAMAYAIPEGTTIAPGDTFTLMYQAELVGLTDPGGNPIAFNGLNTDFEFTLVAMIPEQVVAVGTTGALFTTLPGSSFYLYYDDSPNSVVGTGMGFDDGDLVASGAFLPGELSLYLATDINNGIGTFNLDGLVDFVDNTYLDPTIEIFDFETQGTLNRPPLDSVTSSFFASRAGQGAYDTVFNLDYIDFKADTSSKFSVIPEPSTFILLGAGLLGLVYVSRRKKV